MSDLHATPLSPGLIHRATLVVADRHTVPHVERAIIDLQRFVQRLEAKAAH